MKIRPNFSRALEQLRALRDDVDFAEALDRFAKAGLPVVVCERDSFATRPAGDLVFSYKISDELLAHVAAVRAGNLKLEGVGVHGGGSSSLTEQSHLAAAL